MSRALRLLAAALAAMVVAAGRASALDPERAISQYVRRAWTDRDGLPSMLAKPLAQTPDGYLWVGTTEGLARFDGFRFVTFNRTNTPVFKENEVYSLLADSQGCLWIGFPASGLVRYCSGEFSRVGTGMEPVRSLAEERSGVVLMGTDRGLLRLRDGMVTTVDPALDGLIISMVAIDPQQRIWAAANDGRLRLIEPDGVGRWLPLAADSPVVTGVGFTPSGAALLASRAGVFRWAPEAPERLEPLGGMGPINVTPLIADRSGTLWTGGANSGGLFRIAQGRTASFGKRDGLAGDRALALLEDREGCLWVSTWDGGLNQLCDGAFITHGEADGLSSEAVRTILEDREGRVWVGTVNGLNRHDNGGWRHFTTADGLPHDFVYSLAQRLDGAILVGTFAGPALLRGDRATPIPVPGADQHPAFSLLAERGTLWVGDGECAVRLANGRADLFLTGGRTNVYTLMRDRRGALWFGTFTGIYRMP